MAYMGKNIRNDRSGLSTMNTSNKYGSQMGNLNSNNQFIDSISMNKNMGFESNNMFGTQASQESNYVLVSNLPENCTEKNINSLFSRFGSVSAVKIINNGAQAVVEFEDKNIACKLINTAQSSQFYVGSNPATLEFYVPSLRQPFVPDMPMFSQDSQQFIENRVIHINVVNATYPITVEILQTICSPHGKILRISIGQQHDETVEALVEYSNGKEALVAIDNLHGADIYSGCCNLQVELSRLKTVRVSKNDVLSWDFTVPLGAQPEKVGLLGLPPPKMDHNIFEGSGQMNMGFSGSMQNQFQDNFGMNNSSTMLGMNGRFNAGAMNNLQQQSNDMQFNMSGGDSFCNDSSFSLQKQMGNSGGAVYKPFETGKGVVVMLYGLHKKVNCDHLFNLFCSYGNVAKVRFLKSREGSAMVQMGNAESASLVIKHFAGLLLLGKAMQLTPSNQTEVELHPTPFSLEDETPSCKNYMFEKNNRFVNEFKVSTTRPMIPSAILHFYNAPPDFKEDDISNVFSQQDAQKPKRVVLFPSKGKSCVGLVEFETVGDAVDALALVNHTEIKYDQKKPPYQMKLSFAAVKTHPPAGNTFVKKSVGETGGQKIVNSFMQQDAVKNDRGIKRPFNATKK